MLHAAGVLSGSVYFDIDGDGIRDVSEVGIPGVVVNLADSVHGETRRALTDANGNYTFDELDPGTYEVTKSQSSATIDGAETTSVAGATIGDNAISNMVLSDDDIVSGVNFAEMGLRSEFISIEYFLASSPSMEDLLRESIALGAENDGDTDLAAEIRAGAGDAGPTNTLPVAANDVYTVDEDNILTVNAANGVLANDVDSDGDTLTAVLANQAADGTVSLASDGSFTYTPDADFNGMDTFTYRANDADGSSNLVTVAITVNPVDDGNETNAAPVAVNDSYTVDEDTDLTVNAASGVLDNDTDADGDSLTASLISQPSNGTVSLNADGSFTYSPNADFNGGDSFTYRATDGDSISNAATVQITVNPVDDGNETNQAPVATNDSYTVDEDTDLVVNTATGVLANDTDADGDNLTASLLSQASNGSVSLNANGSFTYTPDADFNGSDSFTYRVSDGTTTSNTATVQITVNPVDEPNELFGAVSVGSFQEPTLLGTRTDLVSGAPSITANHVNGDIDYSNHSNPPTYGDHHGFDPNGTDVNPGITPRPTGIYTEEQPDEDLIHNLEHGHVWISYDPSLISSTDLAALEALVRDGSPNADGSGVGVILTPRADNDHMIALVSWAHLLTLDTYDPTTIREFVETNRGHAPEGFITP